MRNEATVLVFAPGHSEVDHRVRRSVLKFGIEKSLLFIEKNKLIGATQENIKVREMPDNKISYVRAFLTIVKKEPHGSIQTLCIHDSGLFGALLILIYQLTTGKKYRAQVVFDYHDHLDWELLHHLGKIFRELTLRIFVYQICRFLTRNLIMRNLKIDVLVGISHAQLENIKINYLLRSPKIQVVPNTRKKLNLKLSYSGKCEPVWIGNVGIGRDFEKINRLLKALNNDNRKTMLKGLIVGRILNPKSISVGSVVQLGSFANDEDVYLKLKGSRPIGLFFGWSDPQRTNINQIASVNKVYSYINLEIPFLINNSLLNMIDTLHIPEHFIYTTENELELKFQDIEANYEKFRNSVQKIKENTSWD